MGNTDTRQAHAAFERRCAYSINAIGDGVASHLSRRTLDQRGLVFAEQHALLYTGLSGWTFIALRVLQPANASRSILWTLLGIETLANRTQPENAYRGIFGTPSSMVAAVNFVQPEKVQEPVGGSNGICQ